MRGGISARVNFELLITFETSFAEIVAGRDIDENQQEKSTLQCWNLSTVGQRSSKRKFVFDFNGFI